MPQAAEVQPKMKRVITATLLSSFLLVSAAAAQTPATAEPQPQTAAPAAAQFPADARIGFVNLQAVVQNSQLGRTGQQRLKELTDQKSAEIAEKNKEIQALQQEIQSGQNVLAAAVLQQKNAELDRKTRELQFMQEQAQVDVDALQSELLDEFGQKVLPIVEQIRAERNLWAILSTGDGTGLLAVNSALDLSAEVVRRLDALQ
jgi:outer membrane protein